MQDFAPFTPELLGALSGPRPPAMKASSLCEVGDPLRGSNFRASESNWGLVKLGLLLALWASG